MAMVVNIRAMFCRGYTCAHGKIELVRRKWAFHKAAGGLGS